MYHSVKDIHLKGHDLDNKYSAMDWLEVNETSTQHYWPDMEINETSTQQYWPDMNCFVTINKKASLPPRIS